MSFTLATYNTLDRFEAARLASELPLVPGISPEQAAVATTVTAERLYRAKVTATAGAVRRLDADVIAFQEVQSAAVLEDVRALLPARNGAPAGGYLPAIAGPSDRRGIACGVLSRFPIRSVTHHADTNLSFPSLVEGDPMPYAGRLGTRRGVLEVVIELPDGTPLHLLVVHFKSKLPSALERADGTKIPVVTMRDLIEGEVRAEIARLSEALHLRSVVDRRLDENLGIQLAVAGDMNDTPESLTVRAVRGDDVAAMRAAYLQTLQGQAYPLAGRALHSCINGVASPRRQTIEWHGIPETIDHILVTDTLWTRFRRAEVLNERLGDISAALGPTENAALESDHSPIVATFV